MNLKKTKTNLQTELKINLLQKYCNETQINVAFNNKNSIKVLKDLQNGTISIKKNLIVFNHLLQGASLELFPIKGGIIKIELPLFLETEANEKKSYSIEYTIKPSKPVYIFKQHFEQIVYLANNQPASKNKKNVNIFENQKILS